MSLLLPDDPAQRQGGITDYHIWVTPLYFLPPQQFLPADIHYGLEGLRSFFDDLVQLKEPPKEEVLAWKPGQPMRREAFAIAFY